MKKIKKKYIKPTVVNTILLLENSLAAGSAKTTTTSPDMEIKHEWNIGENREVELNW